MQRYSASDLPHRTATLQSGVRKDSLPQAVQHAIQLGAYVLEQRGREGAAAYVRGLRQVLPDTMLEPICMHLQVPMPPYEPSISAQEHERQQPQKPRSEPDMETILKLMQLMKGKDAPDVSMLMQLMGGAGKTRG